MWGTLWVRACCHAGLFDNVLSDYLWARAVLLIGAALRSLLLLSFYVHNHEETALHAVLQGCMKLLACLRLPTGTSL